MIATHSAIHLVRCCHGQMSLIAVSYHIIFIHGLVVSPLEFHLWWIGRGGLIAWPSRSPDLTLLDCHFWEYMKTLVYETPVETQQDLVAPIQVAAEVVRDIPGTFPRVRLDLTRRHTECIEVVAAILSTICKWVNWCLLTVFQFFLNSLPSFCCPNCLRHPPHFREAST